MKENILYLLLSIIAVCLIVMIYYLSKLSKKKETSNTTPILVSAINTKPASTNTTPNTIPDDVAFDNKNLPYRTSRSSKLKVNYGKDFNAYLVKGGTIYHKKTCKRLSGKKIVIKHIYECIADKNKKACPYCNPRTQIHEWYEEKFPDSLFVQAVRSQNTKPKETLKFSLNSSLENTSSEELKEINAISENNDD